MYKDELVIFNEAFWERPFIVEDISKMPPPKNHYITHEMDQTAFIFHFARNAAHFHYLEGMLTIFATLRFNSLPSAYFIYLTNLSYH